MKRIALLLVLCAGCQSTDDPRLTGTIYVLESISAEALPARISREFDLDTVIVYADTIALHDDGTGERRTVRNGATEGTKVTDRVDLTWLRSGGSVFIRMGLCRPNADCYTPQYSGTEANGKITITSTDMTRLPLVYQYLYPPN